MYIDFYLITEWKCPDGDSGGFYRLMVDCIEQSERCRPYEE